MKKAIVKAVVLCTLALSLLFAGVASVGVADTEAVCVGIEDYDGDYYDGVEY